MSDLCMRQGRDLITVEMYLKYSSTRKEPHIAFEGLQLSFYIIYTLLIAALKFSWTEQCGAQPPG